MSLFDEADDVLKRTNNELVAAKYQEADELLLATHDTLGLNDSALKWAADPMKKPPLLTIDLYKILVRRLYTSNENYRRCCDDMNSAKTSGNELIVVARRNREKDTIIEYLLTIVGELSGNMTNLRAKEYAVALQDAVRTDKDYKQILNNIKNHTNDI